MQILLLWQPKHKSFSFLSPAIEIGAEEPLYSNIIIPKSPGLEWWSASDNLKLANMFWIYFVAINKEIRGVKGRYLSYF